MSNPFYTASGNPGTRAQGASQAIRTEFSAIEDAFDMLPATLTANKAVIVNAGGTALTLTTGSLALAGNFTTVGAYAVTLTATGATNVTLPTTGTLSTLAGSETLTNKTLTNPTINGATISGTFGGSITFSGAVTLGSTLTYGGVTLSAAVTGTGSMVLSASPTFTGTVNGAAALFSGNITANGYVYSNTGTGAMARLGLSNTNRHWTISNYGTTYAPNGRLAISDETGAATWFTIDVGGATTLYGATTLSGTLTYGGVTLSAAVTGTGSMVLSASPTMTGTVGGGTFNSTAGAFQYNGSNLLRISSNYTVVSDASSADKLLIGNATDPTIYYRNTTHYFQTIGGGANILNMTGSLATLAVALNYGGVTLSNSVTGTGSMVLSASPTFTGTVSGSTYSFTTADTAVGGRIIGGTGRIRLWGYFSGASTIDATVTSEATYGPLRVTGNPLYLAGNGTDVVTVASSLFTLGVALNYGGVTLANSVTGTGSMVLSTSPSFGGTVVYSSMTGTNIYTTTGVMQMTRDSSTGGGLLFVDSAVGGQNWQVGPGTGSGNKDYWAIYNFTTTTTVLNIHKTGAVSTPVSLTTPTFNSTSSYQFNGATLALVTGAYTVLYDGSARQNLFLGGTGDQKNYYRNAGHLFSTVSGATNIVEMAAGGTTFYQAINYGGVTLSNAVTGTGNMVLSASPTFSGAVSGNVWSFTTADNTPVGYASGASGMMRIWGYAGGAATIDSCTTNQAAYLALRLTGTTVYLSSSGTDKVAVTSSGVTFGSAAMATPSGTAPLAMARAWVNWTGGGTTINSSMNVSSITRAAAGNYTVNFSTAAPNTTFSCVASGGVNAGVFVTSSPASTSAAYVYSSNTVSQTYQDCDPYTFVAIW